MAVKTSATALLKFKATTADAYATIGKVRDVRLDINRDALETTGIGQGDLRLGAIPTVGPFLVPRALPMLRATSGSLSGPRNTSATTRMMIVFSYHPLMMIHSECKTYAEMIQMSLMHLGW